jgi:hypothetical protein
MRKWIHLIGGKTAGLQAGFMLFLCVPFAVARPPMELPVYLEESHAGTFYFLAGTLPLG